nr:hypothetical protein [Tanacetum cinerariifolium]
MLPDVQPEDWRIAVHQWAVLIAAAFHNELLVGGHAQPGPAAAKTGQRRFGEGVLERIEAAQLLVDFCGQRAGGDTATLRAHDFPEQRMVGMAAALIDHRRAQLLGQLGDAGDQLLDGPLRVLSALDRRIEVVDVRLVVLAVVDFHGLVLKRRAGMFAAAVAQQALGARVFAVLADETQKFAVGFITVAQGRPSQVQISQVMVRNHERRHRFIGHGPAVEEHLRQGEGLQVLTSGAGVRTPSAGRFADWVLQVLSEQRKASARRSPGAGRRPGSALVGQASGRALACPAAASTPDPDTGSASAKAARCRWRCRSAGGKCFRR